MTNQVIPVEASVPTSTDIDIDDGRFVKLGYLVIASGLGIFLTWAALAPLDQGVPGQGIVAVINQRKVLQHPTGGLLDEVLVKEGDKVNVGQVIARLNITENRAQSEMVRAQYRASKAEELRLLAELSGNSINLAAPEFSDDPLMIAAISHQTSVLKSRRSVLTSEIASLRENLHGLERQADSYRVLSINRKRQSELAKEQVERVRELTSSGQYPKNRLLELERVVAEQSAKADETGVELGRIESAIADVKLKIVLRQQEQTKEVEARLSELQPQIIGLKSKLDAVEYVEANSTITSPANGIVIGLNFHGKGEVIPPGGRILDIVPENEQLIIEAKFMPDMADELQPNLKVDINFPGLTNLQLPPIEGEVMTVSADQLIDASTHTPYFLARVSITQQGLASLSENKATIQPGMPAEVLIKTGERTLLDYMIEPLRERMRWAFIEK